MLPKHSNNRRYLLKTAAKELEDAKKARDEHKAKKSRDAEERWYAAKQEAEKLAAKAVRRAGAQTLAEQEKVKREFNEKAKQVASEREYKRTISAPNSNRLLKVKGGGADDWKQSAAAAEFRGGELVGIPKIDNIGNKYLGRIKAAEQSKRWSSSCLVD